MRTVRYAAKRFLGPTLTNRIGTWKQALHRRLVGAAVEGVILDDLPWCSPNTFELVVASYRQLHSPYIHEYGSGASTLRHLRELLGVGGTLVSVEHDGAWADRVRAAAHDLLSVVSAATTRSTWTTQRIRSADGTLWNDLEYHAQAANGAEVCFLSKLRPANMNERDPDGTAEQYRDYVLALDHPADVVIVDGRARKACIQHILGDRLLCAGGALALFEAGRGVDGWLDAPSLRGTSDYQPEVTRMMNLGARLIDGTGYDSWPGQLNRRTFGSLSKHYPLELCMLQLPDGMTIDSVEADRMTAI